MVASAVIPSRPVSVLQLAGVGCDEGELEARKAREHLVRADGVEGGELGENEDGDLHAGIVAGMDARAQVACWAATKPELIHLTPSSRV